MKLEGYDALEARLKLLIAKQEGIHPEAVTVEYLRLQYEYRIKPNLPALKFSDGRVITFRELEELEHRVNQRLNDL